MRTELPPAKGDLEPFGQPSEEGPEVAKRSLSETGLPVGISAQNLESKPHCVLVPGKSPLELGPSLSHLTALAIFKMLLRSK